MLSVSIVVEDNKDDQIEILKRWLAQVQRQSAMGSPHMSSPPFPLHIVYAHGASYLLRWLPTQKQQLSLATGLSLRGRLPLSWRQALDHFLLLVLAFTLI